MQQNAADRRDLAHCCGPCGASHAGPLLLSVRPAWDVEVKRWVLDIDDWADYGYYVLSTSAKACAGSACAGSNDSIVALPFMVVILAMHDEG